MVVREVVKKEWNFGGGIGPAFWIACVFEGGREGRGRKKEEGWEKIEEM